MENEPKTQHVLSGDTQTFSNGKMEDLSSSTDMSKASAFLDHPNDNDQPARSSTSRHVLELSGDLRTSASLLLGLWSLAESDQTDIYDMSATSPLQRRYPGTIIHVRGKEGLRRPWLHPTGSR
jgi:hypothetical protein